MPEGLKRDKGREYERLGKMKNWMFSVLIGINVVWASLLFIAPHFI